MDSNYQTLITSLAFWFGFEFSFSPFWVAVMEAADKQGIKKITLDYTIFMIVGFLPLVIIICGLVAYLGSINQIIFAIWHFCGALVIIYLGYKTIAAKTIKKEVSFRFGIKEMCITNWSNPKSFLLVPSGYLASQFSDSAIINISLFYLIGFPICVLAVVFWYYVGKIGAKIFVDYLSYFNAFLLISLGVYLAYKGYLLLL